MEVITSHTNADFDTLASMVAAKRLYPEARLVFSGSIEKPLKDALPLLQLPCRIEKWRDIDPDKITRLILVDVRSPERLGLFSGVAVKEGVDIHIYDHHPRSKGDLRASVDVTEPYGSTTTVMALLIRDRGLRITPGEATIFMAGIYEDTGFLSYPSTTPKDYEAAAFLLASGADLSMVAGLLKKELTPQEVSLLNEFLGSATVYSIDGVEVLVVEGYIEKTVGDISVLAHKIMDIEGARCLFMLADSEDRVHVIARSRTPAVDVGRVTAELGGGGHPHAASATLKGMTLIQAKEALVVALRKNVVPARKASDIMSFPAITAGPEVPLKQAADLMRRYGINAMPVVRDSTPLGVITRQVVDKAVYHGLGGAPVEDYMTTEFEWVDHNASADEIREKVIGHGQRLLPVLKEGKVAGVITRTDLLKLLQEELLEKPEVHGPKKARVLARLMGDLLPGWVMEILRGAGETADALGCRAYVVGGFVRDLILRRENLDIDIVIEGGDGILFAEEFARRRDLRVRAHQRFKTAVLVFPDGFKVDVATARLEYYEKPGALPTVEVSSLKLDLYRRDFIINTLAVALNPGRFGELIDFFGAQKDIKEKTIRVLHNLSFVEDPTRALRAVRFAVKFGFRISTHTLNLIKNAVRQDFFRHLSGARLLDELRHILDEELAVKAVKKLNDLGLLTIIHRDISWDVEKEKLFERAHEAIIWHRLLYTKDRVEGWLVLFLALTDGLRQEDLEGLARRLSIEGKRRVSVIRSRGEGFNAVSGIKAGLVTSSSALYNLLRPIPLEVLLYLMARSPEESTRKMLSNYITKLRNMECVLKGEDLKRLGVPEGPQMGEALSELLRARLDGEVSTREDEEALVKEYMARKGKKAIKG